MGNNKVTFSSLYFFQIQQCLTVEKCYFPPFLCYNLADHKNIPIMYAKCILSKFIIIMTITFYKFLTDLEWGGEGKIDTI